jgi:hypothetical protein
MYVNMCPYNLLDGTWLVCAYVYVHKSVEVRVYTRAHTNACGTRISQICMRAHERTQSMNYVPLCVCSCVSICIHLYIRMHWNWVQHIHGKLSIIRNAYMPIHCIDTHVYTYTCMHGWMRHACSYIHIHMDKHTTHTCVNIQAHMHIRYHTAYVTKHLVRRSLNSLAGKLTTNLAGTKFTFLF